MKRSLSSLLALALIFAQFAGADDFWRAKPFTKWSKSDVEKMLRDSPWAQHTTLSHVVSNTAGISTSGRGVTGVGAVAQNAESEHSEMPQVTYTAQIRSAMPVRQAVVRQRQLQDGYDSMPADAKSALDAKTNAYLAQPQDEIVIYVSYDSPIRSYTDLLRRFWTLQTYDQVKNVASLKIGDEWVNPTGYAATNGAFQFNFPRPQNIPHDGSMVLQFQHPATGALGAERVVIEFKIDKMTIDGQPAI